jgi:hydroxymethylpyrimidine/phosphomethylpyrimidine kinase
MRFYNCLEREKSSFIFDFQIYCSTLLKGGHNPFVGIDYLYTGNEIFRLAPSTLASEKHGSGCVLSSAITANLAEQDLKQHAATPKIYRNLFTIEPNQIRIPL